MKKMIVIGCLLTIFAVIPVFSQGTNIGFNGIGGGLGFLDPDGVESTIGIFVRADLGTIFQPNIGLAAEILYWGKSWETSGPWGYKAEWSWTNIYLTALAKYHFGDMDAQLVPYAGGGPAFIYWKSSWDETYTDGYPYTAKSVRPSATMSPGSSSESEIKLGFVLLGGAKYRLSPSLSVFGEFRYTLNGADFWGVFAGVMYNLGQ
jgi:opacity protein-like surface antigen